VVESNLTEDFYQFVNYLNFPPEMFRLDSVETSFGSHPDIDHDRIYADACGWQDNPDDPDYGTCIGPSEFLGGTVSGSVVTTYTVEVLSAGSASVFNNLYGYNGETFAFNQDFDEITINISAQTPTPTPTQIFTLTPTLTPTITPTPTATGTLSPVMGAGKTPVGTTELRLNNTITFNIRVENTGTGPATNVVLTDNLTAFPYLNIANLETTKGERNIDARIATVDIGTMMPNEVVTVNLTIRVTSTPTTTQNPCNTATITFGTAGRVTTNLSCFRVIGGPALPGTGEFVGIQEVGDVQSFPWQTAVYAFLIFGLISAVLVTRGSKKFLFIVGILLVTASIVFLFFMQGLEPGEPGMEISAQMAVETDTGRITAATPTPNPFSVHPTYEFSELVIETLPAFTIPIPEVTASPVPGDPEPDISPIRRIRIPSIEVDTVVAYVPFEENTWLIQGLREEIAWMGDTSWPGLGGNTGLAGHVTVRGLGPGPFWNLNSLSRGDSVILYTEKNAYFYTVRDHRIVEEWDLSVIDPTSDPQITLITCLDWDEQQRVYLKRLVVFADLLRVDPLAITRGN
jgi:LPXTG-site transpeptidase (sortase) family protein